MSDEFRGDEFRIEGVKARYERLKFFALSEISLKYVYQEHNNELERLFNKDSLNGEDIRVLAAHVLSKRALELWLKDSGNDQKTSDEIENRIKALEDTIEKQGAIISELKEQVDNYETEIYNMKHAFGEQN